MKNIFIWLTILFVSIANIDAQNLILEQDQRIKDKFYYEHTDLSFFAKDYKNVKAFTGYRFIVEDKNDWKSYSRFHAGANVKLEKKWGKIVFRNRYEFTPGHELGNLRADNNSRFRERVKYYLPLKYTKYEIQPNISDEFFFDINKGFGYTRNRFAIGLGAKIGKFKPELYYFQEFKKSSGWRGQNVLGFLVKYVF